MSTRLSNLSSRDVAAATLVASLLALLAAGLHNVADGFADVQHDTPTLLHWGGAVAIELGVVAIGLTIAVRARSGARPLRLYAGVMLFVAASIFANYDASLEALTDGAITWATVRRLDPWTLAKAALLGGAIPLMVLLVIEALRELARDYPADTEVLVTGVTPPARAFLSQVTVMPRQAAERDAPATAAEALRHATPRAMKALLRDEPRISASEVARRLSISRATVYRWRDMIGATRSQDGWIV